MNDSDGARGTLFCHVRRPALIGSPGGMLMQLIAWGGDARIEAAVQAARRAGWDCLHIRKEEDLADLPESADVVLLPWPKSFLEGKLVALPGDWAAERETVLKSLPPCRLLLAGREMGECSCAGRLLHPEQDEAFLTANAELTAEGALARILRHKGRALPGRLVVVTGFGRVGRAMTRRLCAMGAFVAVCARNEGQMQAAHDLGAHPVPLAELGTMAKRADVVVNTVPARLMGRAMLEQMDRNTLLVELASAPYGIDLDAAVQLGLDVALESGLPGRYAPKDAGEALFACVRRALDGEEEESGHA